jgi:hypothetical protein
MYDSIFGIVCKKVHVFWCFHRKCTRMFARHLLGMSTVMFWCPVLVTVHSCLGLIAESLVLSLKVHTYIVENLETFKKHNERMQYLIQQSGQVVCPHWAPPNLAVGIGMCRLHKYYQYCSYHCCYCCCSCSCCWLLPLWVIYDIVYSISTVILLFFS